MTAIGILAVIKEDLYLECSPWEREFVDAISDGIDGLPLNISDSELEEYLSPNQIEKIYEIGRNLGVI